MGNLSEVVGHCATVTRHTNMVLFFELELKRNILIPCSFPRSPPAFWHAVVICVVCHNVVTIDRQAPCPVGTLSLSLPPSHKGKNKPYNTNNSR
jgi:hypothetical protein